MEVENPQLGFPASFCCNCGATDCQSEIQDTRVTRFFGIGAHGHHFPAVGAGVRRLPQDDAAPAGGVFLAPGVLVLITGVLFGVVPRAGHDGRVAAVDRIHVLRAAWCWA